jgi:hypothetical protein
MKCPHCGGTLSFVLCPECHEEIPEKSRYCCWCGNSVTIVVGESDLSERKLCKDGNCVGTINETGICNVCGKPYGEESIE